MTGESIFVGTTITILGIWLSLKVILSKTTPDFILIYTIIMILVGIVIIIFHNEENKIEQRKDIKTKKHNS